MLNHLRFPKQYRTVLMWLNTESDYLEEEYRKRLKDARYAYQDIIKSVIDNGVTRNYLSQNGYRSCDTFVN